jgi:hypothetical protein
MAHGINSEKFQISLARFWMFDLRLFPDGEPIEDFLIIVSLPNPKSKPVLSSVVEASQI